MNLQGAFAVGTALLGPARPGGQEDVPQAGHQAEGAGVDGLDARELLLPGLAQPAAGEVMGAQALVEVAPEGERAVLVALREGRGGDPRLVLFAPAQGVAETLLSAADQIF